MVKPISRPHSQYSLNAVELLGQLVREARLGKAMTTTDLAALCGVPLFKQEQRQLSMQLAHQREKMALLPKAVRASFREVKDDF